MRLVLRSRKWTQKAGSEAMLGEQGIALSAMQPGVEAMIRIRGEMWQAVSDQMVASGETVRVLKVDGLKLLVAPASKPLAEKA
jgi:membrane-bound serine protease (ClpP class)